MDRKDIFNLINDERARQEELHPLHIVKHTDSEEVATIQTLINTTEFLAVLGEEVGEVCKAIQGEGSLKAELVQVASVCIRWLETMKDPK